jgi:hypothetical protein
MRMKLLSDANIYYRMLFSTKHIALVRKSA